MSTDVGRSADVDDAPEPTSVETAGPPPAAPSSAEGPIVAAPRARRRLRWPQFGIQSKLLMMLLVTSIVSCVVVGVVGYQSGREALRDKAFEQLRSVRNARAAQLQREYDQLLDNLIIFTRGRTSIDALDALDSAFQELDDATLTAEDEERLVDYYTDTFVPALDDNLGTTSSPEAFIPTEPAQRYLQAKYTAFFNGDFDLAIETDDVGDGSAWSAASGRYNGFFRELVTRGSYEDALLINADGTVVYSAYSGADLGTDLVDGPFNRSALATAFQEAIESNAVDFVTSTDLERYQPSYAIPSGWAVSPIGDNGRINGVLALQIPTSNINSIMTGNKRWVEDGLGETGEIYLVGADNLMRSTSRLVVEDPEAFEREAVASGTAPDVAARAARVGGTILIEPVETEQVERALRGETGELIGRDYLGNEVLAAYQPAELGDLNWVVIAEIDADEAFAPVDDFTRRIILATVAIIVLVALASLLLAQIFSRPVKRMMTGVRRVAAGDLGAQVASSSTDEFADLSSAFNDMSRSLQTKQELLEAEQAENERLLLTMMPQSAALRYRQGEQTISQDHADVAVVFADVAGFDDYSGTLDSATSLAQLNDVVRQFDEAAARIGVERVRTLRNGYLFSCGMVLPRVDNALRVLDFTREMRTVIERFNRVHGTDLSLRAGIDAGSVTSGLVGRASMLYDLWGDAVNLASRVQGAAGQPGVYVTGRVYDRLRDAATFEEAGEVGAGSTRQQVWRLAE